MTLAGVGDARSHRAAEGACVGLSASECAGVQNFAPNGGEESQLLRENFEAVDVVIFEIFHFAIVIVPPHR